MNNNNNNKNCATDSKSVTQENTKPKGSFFNAKTLKVLLKAIIIIAAIAAIVINITIIFTTLANPYTTFSLFITATATSLLLTSIGVSIPVFGLLIVSAVEKNKAE